MSRRIVLIVVALCSLSPLWPTSAHAQEPPLWPGAKYDLAIPTIKQVLGHDHGEVITPPEGIAQYLQALQKAAPTRTRLIEYAKSWEGRPLWLLVVGSVDRIAKLDQVKANLRRFADPRSVSAADGDRLARELPVVVWLVHGVHGNEISSADAALAEAYHLLASQGDAGVDAVTRDALVLIDPMQNPDGRARFVFQNLHGRAAAPDSAPYSAEHDEPWPGGRVNHYNFDMNRDWFAQSQPETRGRIRIGLEYVPQVTVDLHEQGGDNAYYFAPPADPLNPHITKSQIAAWELIGRANGARFDERGWAYYIREVYDAFYPGYGDSWPTFQGSIGMTYEQASARGLAFARSDGDTLTYRDGVMHHFNAAITTAITAARNRERLMRDYLDYRRSAIAEGEKGPIREYLIVPGQDPSRADLLARNLATQGIDVRRADELIKLGTRTLPIGTYLVSNAQPTARMARNLLDPRTEQPAEFIRKQEERRKMRLNDQIYDITAWNLPMLFDVEMVTSATAVSVKATPVPSQYDAPMPARTIAAAKVGYLMPWGSGAVALSADALKQGIRIRSVGGAFTHNGRSYPIGTAFFRTVENPADLNAKLATLAARHRVEIVPIDSSWVDDGTSLGSNDVQALKAPKVLLVWDTPTNTLSAGWTRYVLERRFGQSVTAVRTSSLARANFNDYDVIVMPSGNFAGTINDAVLNRVKDWLRSGGTLVTMAEATRWATGASVGLLDTTGLLKDGKPDVAPAGGAGGAGGAGAAGAAAPKPGEAFDYDKAIQPDRERPASQPGAILRVTLDTNHWLTAGSDAETQVLIEGNRVFAPLKLNSGRNVGIYGTKDKLIASGLIWPEAQDILVQKAFLMHQPFGQGHVIGFAEDPNYRAFTESTMLLFMNAVLLGPGY
ncbi:MAG: peptidase M14 [Acidobacterium sp.]|nr:MAG: peptidase M14 [Acidobacterium sp.]